MVVSSVVFGFNEAATAESYTDLQTLSLPDVLRTFAAVHGGAAVARLDPNARYGVLALAGRIGAALGVELLHRLGRRFRGRGGPQVLQVGQGLGLGAHRAAILLFFGFMAATSSTSGCCASWGWAAPAYTRRLLICLRPSGPDRKSTRLNSSP